MKPFQPFIPFMTVLLVALFALQASLPDDPLQLQAIYRPNDDPPKDDGGFFIIRHKFVFKAVDEVLSPVEQAKQHRHETMVLARYEQ